MVTSREQKAVRRISDVHVSRQSRFEKWFSWLTGRKVVNLKPTFYKRYPFLAIIGAALLAVSLLIVRSVFTRAEIADFYPVTCLGEWERAQNAQGKPETFGGENPVFDASNSAMYTGGVAKIFCGGFVPEDYEAKGEIKNIGLTLVWQIGSSTAETNQPAGEADKETSSTENPTGNTNEDNSLDVATSTDTINPTENPTPPAAPQEQQSSTTSFFNFINIALAQEAASDDTTAVEETTQPAEIEQGQPSSEATNVPPAETNTSTSPAESENSESSGTIIIAPPMTLPLEPISSSTEGKSIEETSTVEQATSSAPTIPPPQPDENFLEISYSTDGSSWVELGRINQANWKNFTVALPIVSWEELKKLQIKVGGTETSLRAPLPAVLLDGMLLEVQYDLPSIFLSDEKQSQSQSNASSSEAGPYSKFNAPNPFPGLPQVVLPVDKGAVASKRDWKAGESPILEIDINNIDINDLLNSLVLGASTSSKASSTAGSVPDDTSDSVAASTNENNTFTTSTSNGAESSASSTISNSAATSTINDAASSTAVSATSSSASDIASSTPANTTSSAVSSTTAEEASSSVQ